MFDLVMVCALDEHRCKMLQRLHVITCLAVMIIASAAAAEEPKPLDAQTSAQNSAATPETSPPFECARCHSCDMPTPEDKCLLFACTRDRVWRQAIFLPAYQGPDVVILDELEDAYLPVPFDHKGHAEMAEMAGGCVTCHHYTPRGQQHPACKMCHDVSAAQADIDKPTLRGAYHQQCLNCHREWINERNCDVCHLAKTSSPQDSSMAVATTKDDILGRIHPPIPEPDGETYRLRSQRLAGWQVIFRHHEHTGRFGLKCVECHHESSCARCHTRDRGQTQPRSLAEHHGPCIQCHKRDMDLAGRMAGRCERCHWPEDQPMPEPFDHANTGWPLGRFHEDKSCRDCHTDAPFAKLSRVCNDCHEQWSPSTFDHGVTGQVLDDNHAEHDCDSCHIERRFDRPPTCDECHDEEEGISLPTKRPGPLTLAEPVKDDT